MLSQIRLGVDELSKPSFWRAVFAEFFGTFLFLICVTMVALSYNVKVGQSASNVEIAIGIGLSITSTAAMIGHVSGGHLNPAVSFGLIFAGRVSVIRGTIYMVVQLIGGIAGAGLTYGCTKDATRQTLGRTEITYISSGQGFVLEMMFTFMLVLIVLSITDEKKNIQPYSQVLGIGICIMVAHVCLIPVTGCGINPARSFGPAVVTGTFIEGHWIYWIGPLLGAFLASVAYQLIFYVDSEPQYKESRNTMSMRSNEVKLNIQQNDNGIPIKE